MATTGKTLTALAETKARGSVRLPLDEELYPAASRTAAAEAFSGLCRLRQLSAGTVEISVCGQTGDGRRAIGELLNLMLGHALRQRADGGEVE